MAEMEDKLGSILNNPQMMQQIMSMAQSLSQAAPQEQKKEAPPQEPGLSLPDIDFSAIQKLSGLSSQGGIDKEQQALLHALRPYLSRERVTKLEKAMRAAKMAKFASAFLNSGGIQLLTGR